MKKFKSILLILICVFMLSGCIKSRTSMSINKDKSVKYESELLLADSLGTGTINGVDTKGMEKNGFKVSTIKENGYSGFKITKSFDNIDALSKNNGEEVFLNDFYEDNFNTAVLFKVEKGFFKNTYTAKFKYEVSQNDTEEETEENIEVEETTVEDKTTEDEEGSLNLDDFASEDITTLLNEMEISYTVNLPYKAISHNATSTADNGKILIWKLGYNTTSDINYSFAIYNMNHIYIVGGGALLLLIILIIVISIIKKKKTSKETLIHKDYDPSIEGKINETTEVTQDVNMNSLPGPEVKNDLEFTLPEEQTANHVEEVETGPQFMTEDVVAPPTFDPNRRPDFVRDTEDRVFLTQNGELNEPMPEVNPNDIKVDVPVGTELSDMNK